MKTANALACLTLLWLSIACGGANEPAKEPAPSPAATGSAPAAPTAAPSTRAEEPPAPEPAAPSDAPAPAPEPAGTGLTKAALVEASTIVTKAYPAPFEKTYKSVVSKLGEPKKKSSNMYEWFALDGDKCLQFFMTKDAKKGHAASGLSETDAADCK